MKNGFADLRALAAELVRQQDAKKDYIAPDTALSMRVSGTQGPQLVVPQPAGDLLLPLKDHAHRQLAQHLDIPQKYYDRMKASDPDLLAYNVSAWLERAQPRARRMVRTLDGQVRAILSDRYQRIENTEIASVAIPVLQEVPDMHVASCEVTETRLYIKAVFPRIQGEVKVGQVVQSGVMISNSEVGAGAVSVQPFMLKLDCLNGMVSQDNRFAAFHLGARAKAGENVYELLSDEARQADDKAILLKVRDVVQATASLEYFAKRVERLKEAAQERITGNVVQVVEELAQTSRLTEVEKGDVLRHLIEGGDLTRWGLANAVTRAAHDPESYDRATELETLGGQIIDLKPTEWRQLAQAA